MTLANSNTFILLYLVDMTLDALGDIRPIQWEQMRIGAEHRRMR